jgi:hypothetical protein
VDLSATARVNQACAVAFLRHRHWEPLRMTKQITMRPTQVSRIALRGSLNTRAPRRSGPADDTSSYKQAYQCARPIALRLRPCARAARRPRLLAARHRPQERDRSRQAQARKFAMPPQREKAKAKGANTKHGACELGLVDSAQKSMLRGQVVARCALCLMSAFVSFDRSYLRRGWSA